jgi:hypothetical protein
MSTRKRVRNFTLLGGASNRPTQLTGVIGAGESRFAACTRAVDVEELYLVNMAPEWDRKGSNSLEVALREAGS